MKIKETKTTLSFFVQVVPKSSRNKIMGIYNGGLKIKITAPPVEGKANAMCIKFLSKQLSIPKSMMAITAGTTSKKKEITISVDDDIAAEQALNELKNRLMKYAD